MNDSAQNPDGFPGNPLNEPVNPAHQSQNPDSTPTQNLNPEISPTPDNNVLLPFGSQPKTLHITPAQPLSTFSPPTTSEPSTSDSFSPKPKKFKIFLFLFSFILVLIFVCIGLVSYAIAYEKLDIPNYPKVKMIVTNALMSIPFMPKTPKYLIAKTLIAHEKVTKHDYNISMSVDSPGFANITGLSKLDMETKGAIDYENPENIIFTMNASITKDFNFEIQKSDKYLYFKINKVPSFLLAILGLQAEQFEPVLNKWVSYDTTPLETEASKEIKKDTEVQNMSEEVLKEFEDKYLTETIVKKLKIERVNEDGGDFYKLSIDFDKETLDYLEKTVNESRGTTLQTENPTKLSDVIKQMNWSMYINTKTYLTHKFSVTSEMEVDKVDPSYGSAFLGTSDSLTQNSKVKFAMVLKFDKFGEPVVIESPKDAMSFEEFTNHFSGIMRNIYTQLMNPTLAVANDDTRRSDIAKLKIILELYKADCTKYPDTLDDLVTPPASCPTAKIMLRQNRLTQQEPTIITNPMSHAMAMIFVQSLILRPKPFPHVPIPHTTTT
ncbi:MAG: hypothetical protein US62_C0046G0009 [Candidatus Woesebacteria bacterium GW2011_GWA1_37_8]|uniref:Uncharacterized protein n=2 Tax=Candidatus Woeseibacteriota TaxID=1752722 RepID=A0A0G0HYD3_9BACT|nr:MAG: hypothetical protein US62_C0046G0009 [Candidatus Woesebacteria bacterium GW2011_GWA1_37_8]